MATFDYGEMVAVARELLAEFGSTATVSYTTANAFDHATQQYRPTTTTTQGNAVVFGYNKREIDGNQITTDDVKMYLELLDFEPRVGDTVQHGGKVWRVKNVQPIAPSGERVVYVLQLGI